MLDFAGEFTVPCTPKEVYQLLMEPHRLAKCLPDLKRYEVQDQDHFSVTLRVGLGRVRGPMTVKLEIVEKRENSYARIKGKSSMLSSQVSIDGNFTLLPTADGGTLVKWTGNAKMGAYLVNAAGNLLEGVVSETIEQFVRTVKAEAMKNALETGVKAGA